MPHTRTSTDPPRSATPPARSHATVAAGFVTGMLAGMRQRGLDPAPLLAATGIALDGTGERVPLERYAALYNRIVAELGDEGLGLFSRPLVPGCFEFLCRGMLGAATLDEALERAARFLRLVLPDLALSLHRHAEHAELRIAETRALTDHPDAPARVFAFEWLLRLVHGVASWFAGRGLALDAVRFPYARPAHADDYALVYTEHSSFGGEVLSARFKRNLLDLPLRRDEAALAAFLDGAPGRITMLYRRDREMVLRVRDLLRAALPDNPTLEDVARGLHLSPRSLHRRLEEEGSGFRTIKDALRRDLALARLAKSRQPIADLAADLGYADPSAFYRAVVGWTGLSPERFRRQLAQAEPAQTAPPG